MTKEEIQEAQRKYINSQLDLILAIYQGYKTSDIEDAIKGLGYELEGD